MSTETGGRLWIRLVHKHRVAKDMLVPCTRLTPQEALREGLSKLDLSQPMWLQKHMADWDEYALTRFKPEDFVEPVWFDAMEISYIAPEDEKKTVRRRNILEDV